ncbi:MAG: Na/Pi cotransporter family protein [Lachnospiraceae bacterium]|nr:Na/Pi cotransporter family protein [Lachnospiraceae bacterium]MDE6232414.1 Na/Pi cotransporter family protein [Lachnospiraceae bacterium]MDE6252672.1 Na/Pi cotransporter family protein [Lachnospiraceae bacterium]
MDLLSVLNMIGGLALFLYGMNAMGDGLAKTAGSRLEKILEKLTSSPIRGVLLGIGVTAVIQSSSATTVMVVGFVNSGIMKLTQAVGIIMGANVGTTVTSWLLSLTGIEGGNLFVQMLKPTSFSPVLAIIGVIFILFSKSEFKKDVGNILIGFAILMFGMNMMSDAVKPLADVPEFTNLFIMFKNPILGMLVGAALTAIIQSSSASVGILQAMCMTGAVSYGAAIPIIMGQNIGTCVTAMLSSIGANKNARRAALVHLYFNIIGTALFMAVFYSLNVFVDFSFLEDAIGVAGVAVIHSIFNVSATLVLLPFGNAIVKLACLTIKDDVGAADIQGEDSTLALDVRFLDKPGFAVAQCKNAAVKMAYLTKEAMTQAISLLDNYDQSKADKVMELENIIDHYEDRLGTYMVKLSAKTLSEYDSQTVSILLHSISDFERISDHAVNIAGTAKELYDKKENFSEKAWEELGVATKAINEIMDLSFKVFEDEDTMLADSVEPLEEVIDNLQVELKKRHIKRLQGGKCTIGLGFAFSDIMANYERVADHCSNIAVCIIEVKADEFDTHEYLDHIKADNPEFDQMYKNYKKKYALP